MARAKSAERPRSKTAALEETTRGIEQFNELLARVEDLGREGFPYRDAARARAELRLRDCIRRAFGDKSSEYQTHRSYQLHVGTYTETKQSLSFIKSLIAALEDKKLELLGLKPSPPVVAPTPVPGPAPTPASIGTPQMTVIPPAPPTAQVTIAPAASVVSPPMTLSVALTTNLDTTTAQPVSPGSQTVPSAPAAAKPTAAPPPPPPTPVAQKPVEQQQAMASEPAAVTPPDKEPPAIQRVSASSPAQSGPPHATDTPVRTNTPSTPPPARVGSVETASKPAGLVSPTEHDPQEFVKHLCTRFHAVARQLRLRKEYRSTLDVEDEFDVQDLIHAMLRIQFEDVETDEWTPAYAEGAPRKTFLLNHGRLAVVVKKTRPGLSTKDLGDQLMIDSARYSARKRCAILLCFIYDPEGRIGNPHGLEADLTSVSDHFTVDVLVTPK